MLNKQKRLPKTLRDGLHNALLTSNFLNAKQKSAANRHWTIENEPLK